MAKPLKPFAAALAIAQSTTEAAGLTARASAARQAKGKLISDASLYSAKFGKRLEQAVTGVQADLAKLNIRDLQQLRSVLIEARKRLGETTKITVDTWLGKAFEVIAPTLPLIVAIEK